MLNPWRIGIANRASRLPHRLDTPAAERRVGGVGADVGEEAPAAFAFGVGADFDGSGEGL